VRDLWLLFEVKGGQITKTFGKNRLENLTKQILVGQDSTLENNIYCNFGCLRTLHQLIWLYSIERRLITELKRKWRNVIMD
jgi:hypothetical protein